MEFKVYSKVKRFVSRMTRRIWRFYIEKSNNTIKIKYLRNHGMKIGEGCFLEGLPYVNEPYLVEIGNHVAIANGALFITHDGSLWCFSEDVPEDDLFGMIKIGNNVHIGMECIFLSGTSIGNNCVIGAGSVVRGTFPDNSVIIGNPAKVLTNLNVLRLLYRNNPGRIKTAKLTDQQKKPIVKKHFGID